MVYRVFYFFLFFLSLWNVDYRLLFIAQNIVKREINCIEIQVKIMCFIYFFFFCHCENPKKTFLCQNPPHVVTKTIFSSAFWSFIHFTISRPFWNILYQLRFKRICLFFTLHDEMSHLAELDYTFKSIIQEWPTSHFNS